MESDETGFADTLGPKEEAQHGGDATATALTLRAGPGTSPAQPEVLARGAALGRYLIIDELGRGGAGIVYSAFDPDLDRKVALKVLRKSRDPAARARLLREAQAMAKLAHPHVVTVFEVATDNGRDFVAMEYVDGQDLDSWRGSEPDTSEALAIYRQAGQGLAAAHRAGLVHRDFKPHNVLIDKEKRVRVTDFGLATRATAQAEDSSEPAPEADSSLTRTGAIMGTPAYMAPEQHRAELATARSDQFSFCVALYEALAGERPYRADTYLKLKEQVIEHEAPSLPESVGVSAQVRAALARGMSRDPAQRHESMEPLLALLEEAPRRRRTAMYVAGSAVILAAFLMVLMRGNAEDSCVADRSLLAGSWDEEVRASVRAAFGRTGVSGADEVFGKFESVVDAYSDDLVEMRVAICQDSRGADAQNEETMVQRMKCLQSRRQELAFLTSAFSNVDPRGVDRVVEAALGLAPVAGCADTEALQRGIIGPPSAYREEVEELQASLKEARSQGEAGKVKDAILRAEAARDRSLAIDYKPLHAESHEILGGLYSLEIRLRDAEKAFEEAILAAEESGYVEYRARALTGLTKLVAGGSSRFEEARTYARRARAAIAQWGRARDPVLTVDVDLAIATILSREGELQRALTLLDDSLRSYRSHKGAEPVHIARLLQQIAALHIELGTYDEAHALALRSYELTLEELGRSNPRTISNLSTLASTHRMRGEYDEAHKLDSELRAYWASEKANVLLEQHDTFQREHRDIRGHVVDPEDQPVSGATVVCGVRVLADARHLDAAWDAEGEAFSRYRRTQTSSDGSFLCGQTSTRDIVVLADHPALGRSVVQRVPASTKAVVDLRLKLETTGFLSGRALKDGRPMDARSIAAVPNSGMNTTFPPYAAVTFLKPDGSYTFERLAPGKYLIYSEARESTASSSVNSQEVYIHAGRGAVVDFIEEEGDARLRLTIKGRAGASIPSAQVLIVPGHVDSQPGKAFNATVISKGLDVQSHFWTEGAPLVIDDLKPGLHSLCIVPLGGDYRDPEYMSRFKKEILEQIPVNCQDMHLESKQVLSVDAEVPAWSLPVEIELSPSPGAGTEPR